MKSSKKLSNDNVLMPVENEVKNEEVKGSVDFRSLAEPEKTLKRIEWMSLNQDFTHGEHAAATLILLAFYDKPDKQTIVINDILSDTNGFSGTVRRTLFAKMEEKGLIRRNMIRTKGTTVELLF